MRDDTLTTDACRCERCAAFTYRKRPWEGPGVAFTMYTLGFGKCTHPRRADAGAYRSATYVRACADFVHARVDRGRRHA